MNNYIINNDTQILLSIDNKTKIIENNKIFLINKKVIEIIENSCLYYGSSLYGRIKGSNNIIGKYYKPPIIISENKNIIAFPIRSYKDNDCSWILLSSINNYSNYNDNKTTITLKNNQKIILDISLRSFEKQILRSTKLLTILNNRK